MRKAVFAALLTALSAGPALAQMGINILPGDKPKPSEEEQARQDRIDRAYRAATESRPDQKAPADPWGNVRAPAQASQPKAAKPQTARPARSSAAAKPRQ